MLAVFGFLAEDSDQTVRWHMNVIAAALPVILAWPIADTRFIFILFPSMIPMALAGLRWVTRRLGDRPYLKAVPPLVWRALAIVIYVAANNYYARTLSFPWDPYVDPSVSLSHGS